MLLLTKILELPKFGTGLVRLQSSVTPTQVGRTRISNAERFYYNRRKLLSRLKLHAYNVVKRVHSRYIVERSRIRPVFGNS